MSASGPPLPQDPELRRAAEGLERTGTAVEIYDDRWRIVYISTEAALILGLDPREVERYYGHSPLTRAVRFPREWAPSAASAARWRQDLLPIMRHDVGLDDPAFDEVFGPLAEAARATAPVKPPAVLSTDYMHFPDLEALRASWLGRVKFHYFRIYEGDGRFAGTIVATTAAVAESLLARLSRGDARMFARMDRLRQHQRRAAAILFADVEGSGELSRRLSSRAYFELIRDLTDLIDERVAAGAGILGKHAGDGASALFLVGEEIEDEAAAARAAVAAGREIGEAAAELAAGELAVGVKVGLHWGATLTVGQVSTRGRLEVTALGDAMNEAARIEGVAAGGEVLTSKELVERLAPSDARALGVDLDGLEYRTVADLATSEKQRRDAGQIAVADLARMGPGEP